MTNEQIVEILEAMQNEFVELGNEDLSKEARATYQGMASAYRTAIAIITKDQYAQNLYRDFVEQKGEN